jgi:hypothetical protein
LWNHIGFNADPDTDPAFFVTADPDTDPDPGFDNQKFGNLTAENFF